MPEDLKMPAIPSPKPRMRSNRKLLAFLFAFFLTVLIILFFQSSLSRISTVVIEGNELIATETIGQAAQVAVGDRFFAVSSATLEKRVAALRMVQSVKVKKHFPGMVTIHVQEYPKVAFQINSEGNMEAVLADGTSILLPSTVVILDKPILTGWTDGDPNRTKLCEALGAISSGALSDISEIRPEPSDSYPDKIRMYTRSQFEVYTTISYLPDKIGNLSAYIANLQDNKITTGIITMLEVDNHAPFEQEPAGTGDRQGANRENDNKEEKSDPKAAPGPSSDPKQPSPKQSVKPTPKATVSPTPAETSRDS